MDLSATTQKIDPLSLVVDRYNCYPGEQLALDLRFVCPRESSGEVQLILPRVVNIEAYDLPADISEQSLSLFEREQELILTIPLAKDFRQGKPCEVSIKVRVNTFYFNQYLLMRTALLDGEKQVVASEELQVAVYGKGKYLRYLPEIYESDDFTGRFLMLIESFWNPVSQQIDQVDSYFDPKLTPEAFIPWLASWVGVQVDDFLPLERTRALLKDAMMFSQCRGTRQALKNYLEIYTSGKVEIIEKRSENMVIGKSSHLGVEVALGKDNQPNSLMINIKIPAGELERTRFDQDMYQRKIMNVVRTMVPAHARFDVRCVFDAN